MNRENQQNKSWLYEKIKKIDKPLVRLNKNKRERIQITNNRNEKRHHYRFNSH